MQAVIHEQSSGVPLPKFDLFGVPPTQTMIEKYIITEHKPITALDPSSFLQFEIQTAIDEYIDLEKLYFYLKLKLKPINVKSFSWDNVIPANYLLHSMIKQLDIFLGDKQISTSSPTYAYKAYLEALLGFGANAKESHLSSAMWFMDEDNKANSISHKKPDNEYLKDYKTFEMFGRLHTDLSFQGRALLGGTKLIIRILFNEPKFYFESVGMTPEFEFLEASLYVHRSKVPQELVHAHNEALKIATAKYPITLSKVKSFTIAANSLDANIDNIHSGQLPRRIFIFFVDNKTYCGDYANNCFYFQHCNISSLAVYLDGVQYPPRAYTPDFTNKLFIREMMSLYEALDMMDGDSNFKINRKNYPEGNTIFGFNFAPDLTSGCGAVGHLNPIKFGTLRLSLKFRIAPALAMTVLVYCEFDKLLEIDINRNASIDLF